MKAVCVQAQFDTTRQLYTYFVREGDDPKPGDVIVTSISDDYDGILNPHQGEIKMARVISVLPEEHPKATKFYLMLVPRDELRRRRTENQEKFELVKKKKAARAKLQQMVQDQAMISVFEKMAEANPEAAELLAILKA